MPLKEIPFTDEFKDLILDMDFEYFLNEDLIANKASEKDRSDINEAFHKTKLEVQERYKKNNKQCKLWLEGIVRLQWNGGFLPGTFRLDGATRGQSFRNYEQIGEEWAWFQFWQKLERKRRFWKMSWEKITKLGAVLAIALSIIKLVETFLQ